MLNKATRLFALSILICFVTLIKANKYTIIALDFDDTIAQYSWSYKLKLVLSGNIFQLPEKTQALLTMKKARSKNPVTGEKGFTFKDGKRAQGGAVEQFLIHASNDTRFEQFMPGMLNTLFASEQLKPGAQTLLTYLKEQKKISLFIATNKDRISFDKAAKTLDDKGNKKFSTLFDRILVHIPDQQTKEYLTLCNFKNSEVTALCKELLNTQETDTIKHTQHSKPDTQYFKNLAAIATKNKDVNDQITIIFADDKQKNTDAATRTVDETIKFEGVCAPTIKDLVLGLEKHEILNRFDDKLLYDNLTKEGVFGRFAQMKYYARNLWPW